VIRFSYLRQYKGRCPKMDEAIQPPGDRKEKNQQCHIPTVLCGVETLQIYRSRFLHGTDTHRQVWRIPATRRPSPSLTSPTPPLKCQADPTSGRRPRRQPLLSSLQRHTRPLKSTYALAAGKHSHRRAGPAPTTGPRKQTVQPSTAPLRPWLRSW